MSFKSIYFSMPSRIITEISNEQREKLATYLKEWKEIATLTLPISQEEVSQTIKSAYLDICYPEPEIRYFCSPLAAIKEILAITNFKTYLGASIYHKFRKRCLNHLHHQIERQIKPLYYDLRNQIDYPDFPFHCDQDNNPKTFNFPRDIQDCIQFQIAKEFLSKDEDKDENSYSDILTLTESLARPADWSIWGCIFDFCISVLDLKHDRRKWKIVKELIQRCGFIFLFEHVCIICDRPNKLLFDQANRLHAEGEPALQFADGYGVYAYHGSQPPEGRRCKNREYIEPGTKVKLPTTGEYGIVVHCWYSDLILDFDCYIAFYGESFPDRETECQPYILRYAATSLEILG